MIINQYTYKHPSKTAPTKGCVRDDTKKRRIRLEGTWRLVFKQDSRPFYLSLSVSPKIREQNLPPEPADNSREVLASSFSQAMKWSEFRTRDAKVSSPSYHGLQKRYIIVIDLFTIVLQFQVIPFNLKVTEEKFWNSFLKTPWEFERNDLKHT